MKLYTFVMQYLEGTYISQVLATNKRDAMFKWIENLDISEIDKFSSLDKNEIIMSEFIDENPILLKGLKNVWFFMVKTKNGEGYVNFVYTNKQ